VLLFVTPAGSVSPARMKSDSTTVSGVGSPWFGQACRSRAMIVTSCATVVAAPVASKPGRWTVIVCGVNRVGGTGQVARQPSAATAVRGLAWGPPVWPPPAWARPAG
jgi:hypothetical protein